MGAIKPASLEIDQWSWASTRSLQNNVHAALVNKTNKNFTIPFDKIKLLQADVRHRTFTASKNS